MSIHCDHSHSFMQDNEKMRTNERKTLIVIIITLFMMLVEIITGYFTGSMALTADGWHMASHAGALFISYLAYRLSRSQKIQHHFSFGTGKFIPLGGYTSSVSLTMVSIFMIWESGMRLLHPTQIQFNEAILVAVIGLVINIICGFILNDNDHHHHDHGHHDHHHDHNLKSAYMHVMADALTSVFAIAALILGKYYNFIWLDPLMGVIGGLVILKWAWSLCKDTAYELLDGHSKGFPLHNLKKKIEDKDTKVLDIHLWKVSPNAHACELVLEVKAMKGSDHYREKLSDEKYIKHFIVEERVLQSISLKF